MYYVENLTDSRVSLIEGSIDLAGKKHGPDSRARLPDFARNHDDILAFEDQDRIKVTEAGGGSSEEPVTETHSIEEESEEEPEESKNKEEGPTDDEPAETEEADTEEEKPAPEDTGEDLKEDGGEDGADEPEPEDSEDTSWVEPSDFEDMKKADMKKTLRELDLDEDISLTENKPVLAEYYEEQWLEHHGE